MARPFKQGIDYYPHTINMYADDKFLYLRNDLGLLGLGILTQLLDFIYESGYYVQWSEKAEIKFALKHNISREDVHKSIQYLTGTDSPPGPDVKESDFFFSRRLYLDNKVLTSKSIQRYYLSGCTRRRQVLINRKFWLLDMNQETLDDVQERLNTNKYLSRESTRLLYSVLNGKRIYLEPIKEAEIPENLVIASNNPAITQLLSEEIDNSTQKKREEKKGKEIEKRVKRKERKRDCDETETKFLQTQTYKEIDPFFSDLPDFKWTAETIDSLRILWNQSDLPEYRFLVVNMPGAALSTILERVHLYTYEEVKQSILNYAMVQLDTENYDCDYHFGDFIKFLERGFHRFTDSAKPLEIFAIEKEIDPVEALRRRKEREDEET